MTGVFNAKKLATWLAIAPTYSATNVTITDMLPSTAQIRYHHLVHQHNAGLTPMTGMKDPLLDVIVTPDIHTMITRIVPDSVTPDLAPVTTDIGITAARTTAEVAPGHSTDPPAVNVSLNMANLQAINITTLHFCIWQHLGNNHSDTQLQHLPTILSIPVHKVYQHLLNGTLQLIPFNFQTIRRYRYSIELVHPPRNICFSFGIIHTSRNWIILLLFLWVLTCQISMPTFTTR